MIGDYGKDKASKVQAFEAVAIARPNMVTAHTDGVMLSCEDDLEERRARFVPMFRMIAGKKYRITVEELE